MMAMAAIPPWLILARGAQDALLAFAVGACGFGPLVALPGWDRERRWARGGALLALLAGAVWFLAEAASTASATSLGGAIAAVPDFLAYVPFARVLVLRLGLLVLALALAAWPLASFAAVTAATALQPWLGHAAQIGPVPSLAEAVHVTAAGLWLGGLPCLLAALRHRPAAEHKPMLRRFGRLGAVAVALLAATGLIQAGFMLGGPARLLTTQYGRTLVLKLWLFALALVAAAANRFLLVPRLDRAAWVPRALRATIAEEAMIGLLILLAAGWLASLAPGL